VSRQYLPSAHNEEQIEDIVSAYTRSMISFHDWFSDRQAELHKQAFHDAEELRQRLVNSRWHYKVN
jgi:hypothetical protein